MSDVGSTESLKSEGAGFAGAVAGNTVEAPDRHEQGTMDGMEGLVSGQLSRQEFVKQATLLGFSAGAIGAMLAAAGKAEASAGRAFAGQTVNILIAQEGDDKGVHDKVGEIKKRF